MTTDQRPDSADRTALSRAQDDGVDDRIDRALAVLAGAELVCAAGGTVRLYGVMIQRDDEKHDAMIQADGDDAAAAVIDAAHLERQRAWSRETFGPGRRTVGVLQHIRKELGEIEEDPTDVREWVDVVILALDGAWRVGAEPQQIIDAIKAKQERNEGRSWPDWRTLSEDVAIEHVAEPATSGESR